MAWELEDAEQRFGELLRRAVEEGPQVVSRYDEGVAVLLSAETYRTLSGRDNDFKDFLLSAPDMSELELERLRGLRGRMSMLGNDEIEAGESAELERAYAEDGTPCPESRAAVMKRLRTRFMDIKCDLAEELIRERREEAAREEQK